MSLWSSATFFRSKGKAPNSQAEPDLPSTFFLAFIPFILTQKGFRTNEEAAEKQVKSPSFKEKDLRGKGVLILIARHLSYQRSNHQVV